MLFIVLCCLLIAVILNYLVHRIKQSQLKIKKLEKTIEYYINLNQRKNGKEEKNKKGKTGEA